MTIKKSTLLLIFLLIFSFLIRLYKVNNLTLFGDEIDVGYQAFSLIQTGHDYKGNFLPSYIQSLSESRAPLLIYLSIPGIKIFGLNQLGIRITPIVFGVLSIYLFYKLIFILSKSSLLAICSALALSLTPWHFHYSRTSFEVTLLTSLTLLGTYLFLKFKQSSHIFLLYLSIISFGLSFYTYNTANIFTPLLVLFLIFNDVKNLFSKLSSTKIAISLLLTLIIIFPILSQIFTGSASNRFQLISIFNDQSSINQIIEKRTSFSAGNPNTERLFHNKLITYKYQFFKNYLESFSPLFLFIQGDYQNIRHNSPEFGLLFISALPFILIGLFSLDPKNHLHQLMIFWLITSPIASALTINGGHHPTRLFLFLIPINFFCGLGIYKLISNQKIISKIVLIAFGFSSLIEICLYSHEYFIHYPKDSFEAWNYGYDQLFQNLPKDFHQLFISNTNYNSLLPYVFYQKYSTKNGFLSDTEQLNTYSDLSGFNLTSNIHFINNWHSSDVLEKINLLAQPGDTFLLFQGKDIPGDMNFSQKPLTGFKTIKIVYNPNQTILGQIIQKL